MTREEVTRFELEILELLKQVMDPEIEVNIVDLGLIYELKYDGDKTINIDMTFSTPSCPLGDTIVTNVQEIIKRNYPEMDVKVNIVFDPPWSTEMLTEAGRKQLGM